jgi:hypothetical protein
MAKDPRPDTATTLAPPPDAKAVESIDFDQEKQAPPVDGEDEFPNGGVRAWATVGGAYVPLFALSLRLAYNDKIDSWSNSVDLGTSASSLPKELINFPRCM